MPKFTPSPSLINKLARLRKRMAALEEKYTRDIERIKSYGAAVYPGTRGVKLIVTDQERDSVDWAPIIVKYGIKPRDIRKHTRTTHYKRADWAGL